MSSLLGISTQVVLLLALGAILFWLLRVAYLARLERKLRARTGLYRDLVMGLASREHSLLEPELAQLSTLRDVEAIEALLEEQANRTTSRPAWLLDAFDRMGLIQKYVSRLRTGRSWRERAFAAELLGRVGGASVAPALIETAASARSEDADVREIALRALARMADPQAVVPLVDALRHAEGWLAPRITDILVRHGENSVEPLLGFLENHTRHPARPWAIAALGEIKSRRAYPVLIRSLNDPDDEVRAKAATALGLLGDRRAAGYLLERLLGDPAPFVRARIATALGQFNDPEVIDRLVRALGDPAWWVRLRSVEALEHIGGDAEGPLLAALDDTDPEIRTRAAVALERLGVSARLVRAIAEGEPPENAATVLEKFASSGASEFLAEELDHRSPAVRRAVLAAIRRAARRDLSGELVRLATHDPEADLRAAALEALADIGANDALPAAVTGANDPVAEVRRASIMLLGLAGGTTEFGTVRALTRDPDAAVRTAATLALPRLDREGAAATLPELMRDSDPGVRRAALEAAVSADRKALAAPASERLGDPDADVRRVAVDTVGRLGDASVLGHLLRGAAGVPELWPAIAAAVVRIDENAVPRLLDVFKGESGVSGRIAVIDALTERGPESSLPLFLELRRDTEPAVRAAVARALGRVGTPEALDALGASIADPTPRVRASALDALALHPEKFAAVRAFDLLREDPAPEVRERAALAIGLARLEAGETALLAITRAPQPPSVLAAAVLALGAYPHQNMVASVVALADETAVRMVLLTRLAHDPQYQLLRDRLPEARRIELRALQLETRESMESELAEGMRSTFDPAERLRLVAGLRALQGERSRGALLQAARSDPSPQVRTAALAGVGGMLAGRDLLDAARRALRDPSPLVRKGAVELFRRIDPSEGLPALLQQVGGTDDEELLRTVAELADTSFEPFVDLVLGLSPDGSEVLTFAEIARFMRHPGLRGLLSAMAQSGAPRVREHLAVLLAERPELADTAVLGGLLTDPLVAVRRAAVRAAAAAGATQLLENQAADPDAEVRRDAAMAFARMKSVKVPPALLVDPDARVRAAAVIVELGSGRIHEVPVNLDLAEARNAVLEALDLEALRLAATSEPKATRRRAAALCLVLANDPLVDTLGSTDPDPALRAAVSKLRARRADADGAG